MTLVTAAGANVLPIPTPDQVRALSTDPAVDRSAAGLVARRLWSDLGRSERAVFGKCQGSGKDPYSVCIDLAGPAFKCSCPSRKFPCKHGLALGLVAASDPSALPMSEEPADVATWLDGRSAKAEAAAAKSSGDAPTIADPDAAEKRASARERKVAAGLDELDRWIGDIVRRGLAATKSQGYGYWDDEAARLVDAQAGSLARSVRNLGSVIAEGPDWPDRVLARLARLHLVAQAYERIEALPPGLAADVRSMIGWTIKEDDLPADDVVTDEWLVVGRTVDGSDELRTARTWLLGRASGRPALHLAFGIQGSAPRSIGLPGMVLNATCVFYPSAVPLRAAVRVSGVRATATDIPSQPGLVAATAAFASRMATNPFLDAWPVAIGGVRVVSLDGAWHLADASGDVVPAGSPASALQLLALSAGGPVTVFGEWSASGVRLVSAVSNGRLAELAPPLLAMDEAPPVSPPADDAWGRLVSAAMLGTERAELPPDLPVPADGLLPEARLLAAASIETTRRRAGLRPARRDLPPVVPPPVDPRPLPPQPAIWILLRQLRMLEGPSVLAEWVALAQRSGARVPDEAIPALVHAASRNGELAVGVAQVAGPRATWLAERQPEAMAGLRRPSTMTPELAATVLATHPSASVVEGVLADLRTTDAAAFRELVAERWARFGEDEKVAALEAIAQHPTREDEAWLQTCTDDRAVGEQARQVLARLPGSGFARWLEDRAASILSMEGRFRPSLVLTPSGGWVDVVGMVAPAFWSRHLRTDPRGVVERFDGHDEAGKLVTALATATRLHRDPAFAEALLGPSSRDRVPITIGRLLALTAPERRAPVMRSFPDGVHIGLMTTIVGDVPDWTDEMALVMLRYLANVTPSTPEAWQVGGLVRIVAARIPVRFADDLETAVAAIRQTPAVAAAMETLAARVELHRAFAGTTSPTLDPTSTMEATP